MNKGSISTVICSFFCCMISAQGVSIAEGGKKVELLGFALESTAPTGFGMGGGNGKPTEQVIISKTIDNQNINFHLDYLTGKTISNLVITSAPAYTIRLKNVTISGFKQYTSAYKNTYFGAPDAGTVYEEIILKFQQIETQLGSSAPMNGWDIGTGTTQKMETDQSLGNKIQGITRDSVSMGIDRGYETINLAAHVRNNEELQVKVNGRVVGSYTKGSNISLDGFLKKNEMNTVSFIFSPGAKTSDVEIFGKFPGDSKANVMFNFAPKPDKLQSQFELPFAGKRN